MFDTSISALVAAGGNSRAARSARARLQWRDRYGRWIEMGRGVKFKVRGADGAARSVIGSFVGAKDNQTGQVYVHGDPNGLPDGFYDVSSSNAQEFVANLSESQLSEKGIEIGKDVNGQPVGERASEDVPNISELVRADAPLGWEKIPGTFNGKNVIQTDDGDFRVHFGGKDNTTLLEDHRANPGVAEPQRSVAEAFKKVGDVDIQREEGGDQAYQGLGSEEENAAAVANLDRDAKIDQIKMNERTLMNERANLGAKQQAMTTNEALKKELADAGQPYDPEGNDSDEALAARKAAPQGAPEAAGPAAPEAGGPAVSTGSIDLSTFDVAPEGFLIPTGKQTNDITPQGLANFMTAEREHLSKGGSRLVVDSDSGTAEIYNSADTLDDAKAQAGGLGQDNVLDLTTGQPVQVSEGAVDPNSPDVNPNLDGDTSQEAPSAEDRNSDAVEPGAANSGADAPASDQPDGEAQRDIPAATGPGASDSSGEGSSGAPAGADNDGAEGGSDGADSAEPDPGTAPGSVEELKSRRNKTKAALENAGDPEDIIALNEQMDSLDTRIAAEEQNAPEADADAPEADAPEEPDELQTRLDAARTRERQAFLSEDYREVANASREALEILREMQRRDQDRETEAPEAEADAPEAEAAPEKSPLLDRIQEAFDKTDAFSDSNIERRERAALRILRDGERDGNLEGAKNRLSQEEKDSLSDDIAEAVGIERVRPEPEAVDAPETPENEPEASPEPEAAPEEPEARTAPVQPRSKIGQNAQSPVGEDAEVQTLRNELEAIDQEIERELGLAEIAPNDQVEAEHASRVRTLERQRKIYENRLNKALGNAPMDFNGQLGWNMRDRNNRGELPQAPEVTPEPEEVPEADTPAVLDDSIETPSNPVSLEGVYPSSLREGDLIEHPVTGNLIRIDHIQDEYDDFEGAHRYDVSYTSRNDFEDEENRAESDPAQLWSTEKVNTYRAWRDTPSDPAEPTDGTPEEPESPLQAAQRRFDEANADYLETILKDDYTEEEYDRVENAREEARADLYELLDEQFGGVDEDTQLLLDQLDADPERERTDRRAESAEREFREEGPVTDEEINAATPESVEDEVERMISEAAEVNREIREREEAEANVSTEDGLGGLYDGDDNPYVDNTNAIESIKAKMQGKDMTDEERAELEEALDSPLSNNQISRLRAEVDGKPNAADTLTRPRPDREQPEYLSTADVDIVNAERDDPNFVFDEDLTYRRIREEFPNAVELENGDLILDTTNNKGKRYDAMIRRTAKNRFLVYVMETDQSGNRRAKRIGNTEWHSYEALENRITQARKLIASKSPAGSLARRKDQPTENLGTQGFPADDFIGDIGNPLAEVPTTGDEKFDRLLEVAAAHIRNADADLSGIEAHLQEIDPGANAINTIMQAIIGRAQDNYRPDGVHPWQLYGGETAEVGMHVDWTDWHQEKDWWLPNGQLNKDRRPNERYGEVRRGIVMGYLKENSDGKGHTYGDHVWVQFVDDQGRPVGNWVKRSAQTLRQADPESGLGLPFFSKREEWRSDPEALARRFRVPTVEPEEPVQTRPRPRGELPQGRRLRFTSRGTLAGYSNVPVPTSQAEIAGMILSEQVVPQIRPAADARPGMMIVRMDDDGNQHVDSIIRVENLGDGAYRIHAARPDGRGNADVDSFVVPGEAQIALWTSPNLKAPAQPEPGNGSRGELVSFTRDGLPTEGVVVFDDGNGNLIVNTPGGDTIDILESQIEPVRDPEVSTEQRQDLLDSLNDHDIPQYIQDLIRQGIFSPGLSAERYQQLVEIVGVFNPKTAEIRQVDQILDILGATDQQRADVHEFFNAPEQD